MGFLFNIRIVREAFCPLLQVAGPGAWQSMFRQSHCLYEAGGGMKWRQKGIIYEGKMGNF